MYDKIYYPYPATYKKNKYFIITSQGKKINFGQAGASDYTIHKDDQRKLAYIKRHSNENWNDPNTAGYWAYRFLWSYPTKEEAYEKIKKDLLKKGLISKEQYNEYVF
jgi:hypothetical protein